MYTYIPSLLDLPPHLNATHLGTTEHQAEILVLLKIIIYLDITNSNTFTSNYLHAPCQVLVYVLNMLEMLFYLILTTSL